MDEIASSLTEHQAIIDALRRGEAAAAELAVAVNWRNAAERMAQVIDSVGERGSW